MDFTDRYLIVGTNLGNIFIWDINAKYYPVFNPSFIKFD